MPDARQRDALIAAYREHAGPPPDAEARLLAALQRDIGAQHLAIAPGPVGHVPTDSPVIALPRRPWRVVVGLLAAAAVIAAFAVGARLGEPEARDLDPAAAFHGAAATTGVATPRPEVRIPAVPRRTPVPGPADTADAPVDTTDEPATAELAPAPSPPPREPRVRREPAPAPARTLADEMRRMRPAQRALAAGDPVTALAELERYALEFPDGHLREEYLAMHAIARCDAGHAEGRREADEFLRARPLSLFAGRVRSACVTP